MASPTTRGPLETQLLALLNQPTPVTTAQVQELVNVLLDCAREDMYEHRTFEGTIRPEPMSR